MSDPFVHKGIKAYCHMFNCNVLVKVDLTEEGFSKFKEDPYHIFTGNQLLWIERGEDLYASHHYKGRCAARVMRSDFKEGVR